MRFLSAGESHGKALVGILEGMPSGLKISVDYINNELARRQKGYGRGGRMAIETDKAEILSGVRGGVTLGSPIAFIIPNHDHQNWIKVMGTEECDETLRVVSAPRPGHADYPGAVKYGFTDARNILERASARETATRVAVGAIAKQYLSSLNIEIASRVVAIGGIVDEKAYRYEDFATADLSPVRVLDEEIEQKIIARIEEAKEKKDTLGGEIEVRIKGLPVGVGSHTFFDKKLEYALMGAIGSVQSVKSVSIGLDKSGVMGSEAHDEMFVENGKIVRKTNNAGGIEGGISNGEEIIIRASLKPIPTVMRGLNTVDIRSGEPVKSEPERSDICAIPAAGVVLEAVSAFEIMQKISETLGGDTMDEVSERMEIKRSKR